MSIANRYHYCHFDCHWILLTMRSLYGLKSLCHLHFHFQNNIALTKGGQNLYENLLFSRVLNWVVILHHTKLLNVAKGSWQNIKVDPKMSRDLQKWGKMKRSCMNNALTYIYIQLMSFRLRNIYMGKFILGRQTSIRDWYLEYKSIKGCFIDNGCWLQ